MTSRFVTALPGYLLCPAVTENGGRGLSVIDSTTMSAPMPELKLGGAEANQQAWEKGAEQ
jgi:hypothetical protein